MLESAFSLFHKAKEGYLAMRENNPVILSGDYNLKLKLHRRNQPDQACNAACDGKISVAMVDLAVVAALFSLVSLLGAAFALAGYIVRKLF